MGADAVVVPLSLLPPALLGLGEGDPVVDPSLPDPRLLLGAGVLSLVPLVGDGVLVALDCGDGVYPKFVCGPGVLSICCGDGALLALACGDGVTPVLV